MNYFYTFVNRKQDWTESEKGNFQHNTGILITSRRKREGEVKEYVPCSEYWGYFSKNSLRKHLKKFSKMFSTET